MLSCAVDGVLPVSPDLAAACLQGEAAIRAAAIQAEAAIQAATIQANSATDAGWMTLAAGGLAVFGAFAAWVGVNRQIRAAKALQVENQEHTIKRDVYLAVTEGLYSALWSMSRIADPMIPTGEALKAFHAELTVMGQIHLVAPLDVIRAALEAARQLVDAHTDLLHERLRHDEAVRLMSPGTPHAILRLAEMAMAKVAGLTPALLSASELMRRDIRLLIDRELYEKLIQEFTDKAFERGKETIKRAKRENSAHNPFGS